MVTIDVVGLYTNIPHEDIETSINHCLDLYPQDEVPSGEILMKNINHVLKNNVFKFENVIYKQTQGVAMGTPFSPAIANLFMGWLEERILSESPVFINTKYWKRFIDDIIMLFTGTEEELRTFFEFLNRFHRTCKFTYAFSELKISYLDGLFRLIEGFIISDLYTKPTDSQSYLHGKSCHPKHSINNIPYSQMQRLRRLCTREEDFKMRAEELAKRFRERDYS